MTAISIRRSGAIMGLACVLAFGCQIELNPNFSEQTGGGSMGGGGSAGGSGAPGTDSEVDLTGDGSSAGGASASGGGATTGGSTSNSQGSGPGVDETRGESDGESTDTGPMADHAMFVSSAQYAGDFGGLAGGDSNCDSLAIAAGLTGSYRAILSADGVDAKDRIVIHGPVYSLAGPLIAADAAGFWQASVTVDSLRDENGSLPTIWGVWTGTTDVGAADANNCDNWTNGQSPARGVMGRRDSTTGTWLYDADDQCQKAFHLYCIQQ